MNISNIWKHPLTTFIGVATSVAMIAPQLFTLYVSGKGNIPLMVVSAIPLIVGALMRDPGAKTE